MIGSICLWNFSKDRYTGELGYDLHPDHHGLGIMSESIKGILRYAKDELHLSRMVAYTQRNNIASCKLLEKNGFSIVKDMRDPENDLNIIYAQELA